MSIRLISSKSTNTRERRAICGQYQHGGQGGRGRGGRGRGGRSGGGGRGGRGYGGRGRGCGNRGSHFIAQSTLNGLSSHEHVMMFASGRDALETRNNAGGDEAAPAATAGTRQTC